MDSRAPGGASDERRLERAELIAVGSELTTGETRDTNAGDLARSLTEHGLWVTRLVELPDERATVTEAIRDALSRADLVILTGGLGPTPDDLTRESIADALGETPAVDEALERWLRSLWARRRTAFPESNLKQAWLIRSATAIPNVHGTAPGWWVDAPGGRVLVALPGPPREMWPMWESEVVPRLGGRRFGRPSAVRTLRLAGIGESRVADRIGHELLAAAHPLVGTYARPDGIDVRVTAFADDDATAARIAAEAIEAVRAAVGDHVWAEGSTTWAETIESELARTGRRLRTREAGTNGALAALVGAVRQLVSSEVAPASGGHLLAAARQAAGPDEVVLVVTVGATREGGDLRVDVAVDGDGIHVAEHGVAFLRDDQGRSRAAVLACWALVRALRAVATPASTAAGPGGS
jgi:nicotinamide-nucleotide amidase